MPEDIHQRVLRAFQQEHREHIATIRTILAGWPDLAADALNEVFRMAHSLKGGARVCDLPVVERLAHHAEQMFTTLLRQPESATPQLRRDVEEIFSAVEDYMAVLASGVAPEVPAKLFERLGLEMPAAPAITSTVVVEPASTPVLTAQRPDTYRLNQVHLERLQATAGELLAETLHQNQSSTDLEELQQRLQALLRRLEAGSVPQDDVRSALSQVTSVSRQAASKQRNNARRLRLLGERMAANVLDARMVPVGSVFEGFPKMIRDLAADEGKEIQFQADGMELEADRLVLQALKDPVMHSLRNAVIHGIESDEERTRVGKEREGRIELNVTLKGSRLIIRIADDGRGIDRGAVIDRALEQEVITPEEASELTDREALTLLFRPGFSTQRSVTTLAGRGMGLSVVRETIGRLQGSVQLNAGKKTGTELTIDAPLAAASHRLLMVEFGDEIYAIPLRAVHSLHRIKSTLIEMSKGKAHVWLDGRAVLLATLGTAFRSQEEAIAPVRGYIHVVLLKSGTNLLALAVNKLLRELDSLVSPLPPPADRSPFFSGGILLENGQTALVLDGAAVIERFRGAKWKEREIPTKQKQRRNSILVVDDSFTARTLQKNIFDSAGFEVKVATDGVEALGILRSSECDAVVADVQMPRMDGFELLERMKKDNALSQIPVVLVTSLSTPEDRERGMSLGARAYIVKQRFDHQELLAVIRELF